MGMVNGERPKGGKAKGRHYERRLTKRFIDRAGPGRHTDGGGLYLVVDPSGAKRWLLRITVQGKRRDLGLGSLSLVSLDEARGKAEDYRKLARGGYDPLQQRDAASKVFITFDELATRVYEEWIVPRSSDPKKRIQWLNTLKNHAFPIIGHKPVHVICEQACNFDPVEG